MLVWVQCLDLYEQILLLEKRKPKPPAGLLAGRNAGIAGRFHSFHLSPDSAGVAGQDVDDDEFPPDMSGMTFSSD